MVPTPDLSALGDRAAIGCRLSFVRGDLDLIVATLPYLATVLPETAEMVRRRVEASRRHLDDVERRLGITVEPAAEPSPARPEPDHAHGLHCPRSDRGARGVSRD